MTWADKNKVEVHADFITSQGRQADADRGGRGESQRHEFITFFHWDVLQYADRLEPVDEVIDYLTAEYGQYDPVDEYLAKAEAHGWRCPAPILRPTWPAARGSA